MLERVNVMQAKKNHWVLFLSGKIVVFWRERKWHASKPNLAVKGEREREHDTWQHIIHILHRQGWLQNDKCMTSRHIQMFH
jgi:hypothetical protein